MSCSSKASVLCLVLGLAACGSSAGSAAGGATTPTAIATNSATTALASKLGLSPALVEKALAAAKSALGTVNNKQAAAQVGVDTAAADAEAAGKPLVAEQKSGLLEGLKSLV
jgi:hypothetical protein